MADVTNRTTTAKRYYCGHCDTWWDENEEPFESVTVYYNSTMIDCPCGCNEYFYETNVEEPAWKCYEGCLHHDEGARPQSWGDPLIVFECNHCGSEYVQETQTETLEQVKQEAMNCCQVDEDEDEEVVSPQVKPLSPEEVQAMLDLLTKGTEPKATVEVIIDGKTVVLELDNTSATLP